MVNSIAWWLSMSASVFGIPVVAVFMLLLVSNLPHSSVPATHPSNHRLLFSFRTYDCCHGAGWFFSGAGTESVQWETVDSIPAVAFVGLAGGLVKNCAEGTHTVGCIGRWYSGDDDRLACLGVIQAPAGGEGERLDVVPGKWGLYLFQTTQGLNAPCLEFITHCLSMLSCCQYIRH